MKEVSWGIRNERITLIYNNWFKFLLSLLIPQA